jgi:type VI secretion system protein ImpB
LEIRALRVGRVTATSSPTAVPRRSDMPENTQGKITRVRKPRVHITYDVETGGAIEMKELPFVVGVMADLTGAPLLDADGNKVKVKDRKFVRIDRDNFNDVLEGSAPQVSMRVADKLTNEEGSQLNVALKFKHLSDFEPEQVVRQVEPMRKLLEARQRLIDLKGKLDGNDKLEKLLEEVLKNPGELTDALKNVLADESSEESSNE